MRTIEITEKKLIEPSRPSPDPVTGWTKPVYDTTVTSGIFHCFATEGGGGEEMVTVCVIELPDGSLVTPMVGKCRFTSPPEKCATDYQLSSKLP